MAVKSFITLATVTKITVYCWENTYSELKIILVDILNYLLGSDTTVHIRHQCRKATIFSSHRWLINTGVEKMNYI
jgi:hypothetical protein